MDQHEHSSKPGKFMAVRAASGALRGVAQHGMTLLCIPLYCPSSHHHDPSLKLLDLPHPSSISIMCHISWLISAPAGAASCPRDLLGQQGSSAAPWSHKDQDPGCFPVCPGVSPSPDFWWWRACRGPPAQLMPLNPTANK